MIPSSAKSSYPVDKIATFCYYTAVFIIKNHGGRDVACNVPTKLGVSIIVVYSLENQVLSSVLAKTPSL